MSCVIKLPLESLHQTTRLPRVAAEAKRFLVWLEEFGPYPLLLIALDPTSRPHFYREGLEPELWFPARLYRSQLFSNTFQMR
jgi:hypothetical protein